MLLRWLLLFLLLPAASVAAAQMEHNAQPLPASSSHGSMQNHPLTDCPWLTRGTAARALGGDVLLSVNMSNTDAGSCKFSLQQKPADSLEIVVSKSALETCPAKSPEIKGVGNWATRCRTRDAHGESSEMISSQARDTYFTITLTLHARKHDSQQDSALEPIAEEVAGILY